MKITDNSGANDDSLAVTSVNTGPCNGSSAKAAKIGSFDLGSNNFITGGDATFSTTTLDYCTGHTSTGVCSDTNVTGPALVLTLGGKTGGTVHTVGSVTATFTPNTSITNTSGRAATATPAGTSSAVQF